MKISKKLLKVLIILLVLAVYFNIGHYYGQSWIDASVKSLNDKPLSFVQEGQLGGWKYGTIKDINSLLNPTVAMFLSVLLWPIVLVVVGVSWIVYAVIHGFIAFCHVLVFLFEFIFYGGFFELIGPGGSCLVVSLVVVLIVGKFLARRRRKREKNKSLLDLRQK